MRAKPSTEEPSNHIPSSSASSNPLTGISTLFTVPVTSVNCNEMNLTSSSFTCLIKSFASIFSPLILIFQLHNADGGLLRHCEDGNPKQSQLSNVLLWSLSTFSSFGKIATAVIIQSLVEAIAPSLS